MRSSHRAIASVVTLLLAGLLSACATEQPVEKDGQPATTTPAPSSGTGDGVNDAHNEADTMFAQMMIVHHEGAIEMADMAIEHAESRQVRSLAEEISTAQGPEIETMTSWLGAWEEPMMATSETGQRDHGGMQMDDMTQEEAMTELARLSGAEFDTRFLELMIAHHQGAVQMAEDELNKGQNPWARELAQQIIKDQRAEINQMQDMIEQSR